MAAIEHLIEYSAALKLYGSETMNMVENTDLYDHHQRGRKGLLNPALGN
jgi:hypothetical protein